MPEKETRKRAEADRKSGKAATTQAGEYVREEIHHVREGKHGVRSAKQAIAIGLSKAPNRKETDPDLGQTGVTPSPAFLCVFAPLRAPFPCSPPDSQLSSA